MTHQTQRQPSHWKPALGLAALLALTPATRAGIVLLSTMDSADIIGTTVHDNTSPAEHGALQSNVATGVTGRIGQAIDASTPGTAASVSYGNVHTPGTGDMTVSIWFHADTVRSQVLARKGNAASGDEGWSLQLESRNSGEFLRVFGRANATGLATNDDRALLFLDLTPTASTGQWHHAALVIHGSGSIELYVNGADAGVAANVWGSTFNTDANGIGTGASLLVGLGIGSGTDMKLDDFAIFDEALDAAAIATIYQNGLSGIGVAVPEPASLGLLALGATAMLRRRVTA